MADDMPRRKSFEPPPWERDAFDELKRRRDELADDEQIDAAVQALRTPADEPERLLPEVDVDDAPAPPAGRATEAAETAGPGREAGAKQKEEVDPAVQEMLFRLKSEEPKALAKSWGWSAGAAVVFGVIGMMFLVWGLVALARTKGAPEGLVAATMVLALATGCLVLCAWLVKKANDMRGA